MNANRPKRAPGRPKADERSPSMRDAVLRTASSLFMEHGYEPVTLNTIAERCGVTKASVYYYFANKAELFTASVIAMMDRIAVHTKRLLDGDGSLRERLTRIAEVKLAQTHVEFETMMREAMPSLSEAQRSAIRLAESGIHDVLADGFREAMEGGEIRRGNPLLLSHAYSALLMIGNRDAADLEGLKAGADSLAADLVAVLWEGLSPVAAP